MSAGIPNIEDIARMDGPIHEMRDEVPGRRGFLLLALGGVLWFALGVSVGWVIWS